MKMSILPNKTLCAFIFLISVIFANANVTSIEDVADIIPEEGIWGPRLEELALGSSNREKRVMKLIPVGNAFGATKRISDGSDSVLDEKESKISPGKVINNYNNKPIRPTSIGGGKQVSETDLYLLGAIEKLVYRMDFMEKRLRKLEEMLYYVMAGSRIDKEPCQSNFTRIGGNCYMFHANAGREMDWKTASNFCKKTGATLAEMETIEENQDMIAYLQALPHLKGKDFWTGGLNPGLLWIWSNSARPVAGPNGNKKNPSAGILGDGRCLRLSYDPALRNYSYKGSDCSIRYSVICEIPDSTGSNEISRIGRSKHLFTDEL